MSDTLPCLYLKELCGPSFLLILWIFDFLRLAKNFHLSFSLSLCFIKLIQMAGYSSRADLPTTIPVLESDVLATGGVVVVEDEEVSSMAEILRRPGKAWNDFHSPAEEEPEPASSIINEEGIAELKARWGIPHYVEMLPAVGNDIVHFDRPGYCAFYAYPFIVGYTLPLPLLVVDFCRFY